VQTSRVDPRDVRWEMDGKVYRVHFWEAPSHPDGMYSCWETRLTDIDSVTEALDWSATNANGRDVVVHLELQGQPGAPGAERGLMRLHGHDPNEAPGPSWGHAGPRRPADDPQPGSTASRVTAGATRCWSRCYSKTASSPPGRQITGPPLLLVAVQDS